jgi:hypothetical protein
VLRGEARVGQRSHGSSYSAWPPCNTGCACPACQNDFASLPGEFATVGKLIQRHKTEWSGKLRPKKIEFASLPLRQGSLGKGEEM